VHAELLLAFSVVLNTLIDDPHGEEKGDDSNSKNSAADDDGDNYGCVQLVTLLFDVV
jgi:hypothetical protein